MKRFILDGGEFPHDPEQSLDIVVASPDEYGSLIRLAAACDAFAERAPPIEAGWAGEDAVRRHLREHAGIELPHPSAWRESLLVRDEWNERELGIAAGPHMIWYRWSTSA